MEINSRLSTVPGVRQARVGKAPVSWFSFCKISLPKARSSSCFSCLSQARLKGFLGALQQKTGQPVQITDKPLFGVK